MGIIVLSKILTGKRLGVYSFNFFFFSIKISPFQNVLVDVKAIFYYYQLIVNNKREMRFS